MLRVTNLLLLYGLHRDLLTRGLLNSDVSIPELAVAKQLPKSILALEIALVTEVGALPKRHRLFVVLDVAAHADVACLFLLRGSLRGRRPSGRLHRLRFVVSGLLNFLAPGPPRLTRGGSRCPRCGLFLAPRTGLRLVTILVTVTVTVPVCGASLLDTTLLRRLVLRANRRLLYRRTLGATTAHLAGRPKSYPPCTTSGLPALLEILQLN